MSKYRYLEPIIQELCFDTNKMAFISGPRQCGKTTLSKNLLKKRKVGAYYNWDELNFRKTWAKNPSTIITSLENSKGKPLLILDEIHKAKLWKRTLKGLYDTRLLPCDILVTGSARLNVYRKGSDSLMGRYYHMKLHPFSLAEMLGNPNINIPPTKFLQNIFNSGSEHKKHNHNLFLLLDKFGPFPEPLFHGSEQILNLWRRGRIEKIIREDLRDISRIPELSQIEMLVALINDRVANPLSIQALSEDLEVAYTTIKRWLLYLQELYYYFTIKPYHKSLKRSLKKTTKLYLWDFGAVEDEAKRFENLIAFHLLKFCDFLTDSGFGNFELKYLRDKEQHEIDFLLLWNNKPWFMAEAKLNHTAISPNFGFMMKQLSCKYAVQIVKKTNVYDKKSFAYGEVLLISSDQFLSYLV
jgi:uncharacterized protein